MRNGKRSIVTKMVLGVTAASAITYATSAFCLLVVKPSFPYWPGWVFDAVTLALGVCWTGVFGYVAARRLLRPLLELTGAAKRAAEGDLRTEPAVRRSGDELESLSRAFGAMLAHLRTTIGSLADHSGATDVHVRELREAIAQAAGHIERMTEQAEAIAGGAGEQASSAARLAGAMDRLTAGSERIVRAAADTRERVRTMNGSVERSGEVFRSLVAGMGELASLNREAREEVRRLAGYADSIGSIAGTVGDMAEQTQLLALNAAIEAARAGEEGKGFEVVAQAVKSLAVQSADSAKRIGALIAEIQGEVAGVVRQIERQHAVASREADRGAEAEAAYRTIAEEARQVGGQVEAIAERLQGQLADTTLAMAEVRKVAEAADAIRDRSQRAYAATQEQTAVMQEIAASSNELADRAHELRRRLDAFQA